MAEFESKGKQKVDVHFVSAGVSCVVEEKFEGHYHDNGDLLLGEVLQDQESVYQSLQRKTQNDLAKASLCTDSRPRCDHAQSSGSTAIENSSESMNAESQVTSDEAYARSLQELEYDLAEISLSETTGAVIPSNPADTTSTSSGTSGLAARQDDIDPDYLTYEQLLTMEEAIGTKSRGLSDELISYLPSSTYKIGFFSRKDKHEECVICLMPYKNRQELITLPCRHHYHSHCITRWLKINKACPICNDEVFGS